MEAAVAAATRELAAAGVGGAGGAAAVRAAVVAQLVAAAHAAASRRQGNAERGADPAPYAASRAARRLPRLLTPDAAAALASEEQFGGAALAVLDDALDLRPGGECATLLTELAALADAGRLALTAQAATRTRSDRVAWLSEAEAAAAGAPALAAAICALKALAAELNAAGVLRGAGGAACVVPARAQVALYEPADDVSADASSVVGYVPHWDSSAVGRDAGGADVYSNRRRVTLVLYACPADWDAARHGGCLRCHVGAPPPRGDAPGAQAATKAAAAAVAPPWAVQDFEPFGGRVVVFDARRLLHEVLPARRRRFAVTLWAYEPLAKADATTAALPAVAAVS